MDEDEFFRIVGTDDPRKNSSDLIIENFVSFCRDCKIRAEIKMYSGAGLRDPAWAVLNCPRDKEFYKEWSKWMEDAKLDSPEPDIPECTALNDWISKTRE